MSEIVGTAETIVLTSIHPIPTTTTTSTPTTIHTLSPGQFKNNTTLSEIVLSVEITCIPRSCFEGCSSLMKITIPASVKKIEYRAFASSGLKYVIFEEGSSLRILPVRCFDSCLDLTLINIPSTIAVIGKHCFNLCSRLKFTQVIHPNSSLRCIGAYSFASCQSLGTVSIPTQIEEIQSSTFLQSHITSLEFGGNMSKLQVISPSAFQGITGIALDSVVYLPPSLEILGFFAFYSSSIVNIVFQSRYSSSGSNSISNSNSNSNSNTNTVDSNNTLGIKGCRNSNNNNKNDININETNLIVDSNPLINDDEAYEHMLQIHHSCFRSTLQLQNVTFLNPNFSLRHAVFHESTLNFISFPTTCSLNNIPENAFAQTSSLEEIIIPYKVRCIQTGAFYTTQLKNISFQNDNLSDDSTSTTTSNDLELDATTSENTTENTIENTTSVSTHTKTDVPTSSLLWIGSAALACNESLEYISLPNSLLGIDAYAFFNVNHLQVTTYNWSNKNIKYIKLGSFSSTNLAIIQLPSTVVYLGERVFAKSSIEICYLSPTSSNLSNSSQLINIPPGFLSDCIKLSTLYIPHTVQNIHSNAFASSSIENIFILCPIAHHKNLEGRIETTENGEDQNNPPVPNEEYCTLFENLTIALNRYSSKTIIQYDPLYIPIPFLCNDVIFIDDIYSRIWKILQLIFSISTNHFLYLYLYLDTVSLLVSSHLCKEQALKYRRLRNLSIISSKIMTYIQQPDLNTIAFQAFIHCGGLNYLFFPQNLVNIGQSAFQQSGIGYFSPMSLSTSNLALLADSVFESCKQVNIISIPKTVKIIGANVFLNSSVVCIDIERGSQLQWIGASSCRNTYILQYIYIPATIKILWDNVFERDVISTETPPTTPTTSTISTTTVDLDTAVNDRKSTQRLHIEFEDLNSLLICKKEAFATYENWKNLYNAQTIEAITTILSYSGHAVGPQNPIEYEDFDVVEIDELFTTHLSDQDIADALEKSNANLKKAKIDFLLTILQAGVDIAGSF